jgi:hypothetical protein
MTPNHVCEQATQKMIDEIKKMGDPGRNTGMADILRKKITDLAVDLQEKERENNQLRAELEKAKKATNQQAINALKLAYRKHCLSDASIGWIELEDILRDALCEAIGDKAFQQFLITWEE